MKTQSNITSNKKFGYFFTSIFFLLSIYFFNLNSLNPFYLTIFLSLIFFLITLFKDYWLKELNNIWFKFGILLSKLISPLILAFIFYFIITPFGVIKKIFKLGTINYENKNKNSFWRDCKKTNNDFNNPF